MSMARRSALTALETQHRLYRIGMNVHTWSEVHAGLTSAAILDENCVAIGISNTGRTDETIHMLSVAKAAGAYTVAITGNPDFPLGKLADDVLTAAAPNGYLQPADLSPGTASCSSSTFSTCSSPRPISTGPPVSSRPPPLPSSRAAAVRRAA